MSSSEDFGWAWEAIGSNYVFVATYTFFMMDYFETLESEITLIWPDKLGVGKVLFLLSRYFTILRLPLEILPWFPTGANPTSRMCKIGYDTGFAFTIITTLTTSFSLVLCAHALLGAKMRYLAILIFVIGGFYVAGIVISAKYMAAARWIVSDVPWLSPCWYNSDMEYLIGINAYLGISRDAVLAVLMAFTIYFRYRFHSSSLVTTMRRDIGFYFSVLTVVEILHVIFRTPGSPVSDKYNIISGMRMVLYPMLANRVLLNIRTTSNLETRATAISTLLFTHTEPWTAGEGDEELQEMRGMKSDSLPN